MKSNTFTGHLIALITIFIWGTTFVSTKVILQDLSPVEILFYRFALGYLALWLIYPKFKGFKSFSEEFLFFSLGLTGITLYFLIENIALEFTYATNVGLIVSTIPILTALLAHIATKDEKISRNLVIGFIVSFLGIFLVIFNGKFLLKLNPVGDVLALLASIVWAVYSVLLKKVDSSYPPVYTVRKSFFYGLLTIVPILYFRGEDFVSAHPVSLKLVINIAFLGLAASALCFVLWNASVKILGAVKASNYIYLVPLITMITSVLILHEKVTALTIFGGILIILGVSVSEKKFSGLKEIFLRLQETANRFRIKSES
ncbi:MAG: DMT family transporter [Clostridia bacterium]|nr:DMT family transporter [Clostridia bacterium]